MKYYTEAQKALIGAVITSYNMTSDGTSITFNLLDRRPIRLDAKGDCCSYSWIESIDNPGALLGTVQSVEDIDMPDLGSIDSPKHQGVDCVRYYGLKITTEKGDCVLDYRNDSNGYYGGSLTLVRL